MDLLKNSTVVTLLANSEFIELLKQSGTDAKKLSETLGISKTHLNYVTDTESGKGLLKHGKCVVPFDMTVKKDSRLYRMFDTNLHEKR